jgi:hypothetical protein
MKIEKAWVQSGRQRAALAIAMIADVVQIGLFPLFFEGAFSYFNDALDVVITVVMLWLLGWHWAFLPSIIAEVVPGLNIIPTWTAAIVFVLRSRATAAARELPPADADQDALSAKPEPHPEPPSKSSG